MKNLYTLLLGICITSFSIQAQYKSNVNLSAQQLVNILVGHNSNLVVSNVTSTWEIDPTYTPVGSFTATGTNIGINEGIILTTGSASDIPGIGPAGPNNTILMEGGPIGGLFPSTNDDMSAITGYSYFFDLAMLEFDFIPCSDTIKFRYVFASEEYPDYVCTGFNDAFAFILSGGTTHPITPTNIALIPGSTTPVSINTINGGVAAGNDTLCGGPGAPGLQNTAYFVDNANGTTIQYNGFTTVLTALAAVVPGEQYHIKLIIADVSDSFLDSGVFLEAGSFTSTPFPISLTTSEDTLCTRQNTIVANASTSINNLTYTWDFDEANISYGSGKGPYQLNWSTPGEKKIIYTLNTCSAVDTLTVFVREDCDKPIETPNIFTPNNDGSNDELVFNGLSAFPNSLLKLYNRWGNLIHEDSDYKNNWTANNVPDGVYFYVLELASGNNYSGQITILRKN